jgi:hypothetical protein
MTRFTGFRFKQCGDRQFRKEILLILSSCLPVVLPQLPQNEFDLTTHDNLQKIESTFVLISRCGLALTSQALINSEL